MIPQLSIHQPDKKMRIHRLKSAQIHATKLSPFENSVKPRLVPSRFRIDTSPILTNYVPAASETSQSN